MLILKHIWVGLWTILGAIWFLMNGSKYAGIIGEEKALAFVSPSGLIKMTMDKGQFTAMTTGAAIVFKNIEGLQNRLLVKHELHHVKQGFKFGLVWPVVYYCASISAWLLGKDAYWDNYFEIEARAVAASARSEYIK